MDNVDLNSMRRSFDFSEKLYGSLAGVVVCNYLCTYHIGVSIRGYKQLLNKLCGRGIFVNLYKISGCHDTVSNGECIT